MRTMIGLAALGLLLSISAPASAGKFNKVLSIGAKAPEWEDLEGTDGKKHSLADLKDRDVVVVIFTCNSCPVAEGYEDRIIAFATANPKVGVVAINVNTIKEDALPAMKERAKAKKFPYPYLFDPTQEIAKKYGAKYTPEFFVLNKERQVVYMGSMDDKQPPGEPKTRYLELAVKAASEGKAVEMAETSAAAGCAIRINKKKDD